MYASAPAVQRTQDLEVRALQHGGQLHDMQAWPNAAWLLGEGSKTGTAIHLPTEKCEG